MSASNGAQRASTNSTSMLHGSRRTLGWTAVLALVICSLVGAPGMAEAATPRAYGPGIAADSLNNSQVGGRYNSQVAYRFRATESSALRSIGIYIIGDADPGYAGGNGGTLRITVRRDDGTRKHRPSSAVLATRDVVHPTTGAHNTYSFPDPAKLKKGRLYHIVFTNIDPSPRSNFVSLDGLFVFDERSRWQPAFSNTDWANLTRHDGGAWSSYRGRDEGTITPIMQLNYANGKRAGVGYMEIWVRSPRIISGDHRVREVFTFRGKTRTIRSVSVRVKRLSGSSPLVLRLIRSDGKVIARGTVSASEVRLTTASDEGGARWVTLRFKSKRKLQRGRRYQLVVSTSAEARYSAVVIRKGGYYRYHSDTYFRDGTAQWTSGSGWTGFDPGWSGPSREGDLQMFFR